MPSATLAVTLSAPTPASKSVPLTYTGLGGAQYVELTGAGTYTVDLAMMPTAGLNGLVVLLDDSDATGAAVTTPVSVHWTEGAVPAVKALTPGGWFGFACPSPAASVTALSIVYTANAIVRVYALG